MSAGDAPMEHVLDETLERLRRGEAVDLDAVAAAHPALGDELRAALQSLAFVTRVAKGPLEGGALGPYRILREVGRGGMGVVYEAVRAPDGRRVALKVLPPGALLDARLVQRFENEALAATRLQHPNIVPVLAVGSEEGVRFLAMEFIEGESLAAAIPLLAAADAAPDHARRAAGLVAQAADALAYAHDLGLVHRDVKPGNLLLDREGKLWLTDFGLAHLPAGASLTRSREVLGTRRYMSPEQARGLPVDHRADIYGLGATLYEVVARAPAFPGDDPEALLQAVLVREPVPLERRRPGTPRDLATIVQRAMAKEPSQRYATAGALASDLRRFAEGHPIVARRPGPAQRLSRWARRHRTLVATGGVAAVLLLGVVAVGLVVLAREQVRTQEALEGERREGRAAATALLRARVRGLESAAALAETDDPMLALLLAREAARLDWSPSTAVTLRDALEASRERWRAAGIHAVASVSLSATGAHTLLLDATGSVEVAEAGGRRLFARHVAAVCARFSPAGDRVAAGLADGRVLVYDLEGQDAGTATGDGQAVRSLAWDREGRRLITVHAAGAALLWDAGGCLLARREPGTAAWALGGFDPEGSLVLVDARGGILRKDGEGADALATPVRPILLSPDADSYLATGDDGAARLVDVRGARTRVLDRDPEAIGAAAFSPDGRRILVAGVGGSAVVFDRDSTRAVTLRGHAGPVVAAAFAADGATVLTASSDRTARLWDRDGNVLAVLRGHEDALLACALGPGGRTMLTGATDRTARLWDLRPPEPRMWQAHQGAVLDLLVPPAGDRILSRSADGTVRLWDAGGNLLSTLDLAADAMLDAACAADGSALRAIARDGSVRAWRRDGSPLGLLPGSGAAACAGFAFGGEVAFDIGPEGDATIRASDGTVLRRASCGKGVACAAVSESGELLVTGHRDGRLRFDAPGGVVEVRAHAGDVVTLAVAPNGDRVASAGGERMAHLWSATGGALADLASHEGPIVHVAFSPRGDRILTVARDRAPRIWDRDGHLLAELYGHALPVRSAAFAADGEHVLTTGMEGTMRLWDGSGREVEATGDAERPVTCAALLPGGRLATGTASGGICVWRTDRAELLACADARILREFTRAERERYRDLLGPGNETWIEAELRLEALIEEHVLVADAMQRLRDDGSLAPAVRDAALRSAARRSDDAERLNREAWGVVRTPSGDPARVRHALRLARAAVRLRPDNLDVANTLGTALYRAGAFAEAVEVLDALDRRRWARAGRSFPDDLAFLAMAQHRLGRAREAAASLARLRACAAEPRYRDLPNTAAFLAEAEAVVAGAPAR